MLPLRRVCANLGIYYTFFLNFGRMVKLKVMLILNSQVLADEGSSVLGRARLHSSEESSAVQARATGIRNLRLIYRHTALGISGLHRAPVHRDTYKCG